MEENPVELIDYFRVIWKRKILIIVVTLVCLGVGVGVAVKNSISKSPPVISYHASVIVKIGQMVGMSFTDAYLVYIEKPEDLVAMLPLWYGERVNEPSGYHFSVRQIAKLSMLELTLEGSDKEVSRVLKKVVDMLVDEHGERAEASAAAYKNFIRKLEEDAKMVQENIVIIETTMAKMKNKERNFMEYMDTNEYLNESGNASKEEKYVGDRSVIWNMLYLKTIDKEIDLSKSRQALRNIQWQLLVHRTTIGNIADHKTKVVGEIESTAVTKLKKKKINAIHMITITGVAGLIMSLFIVFFIEYIEESKSRRKGK